VPGYQVVLRAGFGVGIAGSRRPGCWRLIAVLRSELPRRITSLWIWHPQRCPPGGRSAVRWDVGSACASPAVNIRKNSESCAHPRGSRRTRVLNKAGQPAEKRRGRLESRARALTGAQTENLPGLVQRGGIHRKPMAMLRKTRRLGAGTRTPMRLTTGDLDSVVGRFGSPRQTLLRNCFGKTGFEPTPWATNGLDFCRDGHCVDVQLSNSACPRGTHGQTQSGPRLLDGDSFA
jgi:hypothetical protein